ncbi:hypothetical protein PFISCL1PPCAC_4611, partial [Pristionchus fissidentatus]
AEVYDKPGVRLTKPLQIGEFSCHANLSVTSDSTNLRYLIHTEDDFEPLFNLDNGFKTYHAKDPNNYKNDLKHLQQWALTKRSEQGGDFRKVFQNAEIVCCRGALTNMASTPYCGRAPWRIVAVLTGGIIYLHDCGGVDGKTFQTGAGQQAHLTYWGHSFQRMMTNKHQYLASVGGFDDSEEVDCRETFSVVYRSDIIKPDGDRIKLTYSAEIKAIDENDNYVDFKTQASHLHNGFWLKKSWFWWLQCHLAGVDRVYAGFRSDLGIVHSIRKVERTHLRQNAGGKCDVVMTFLATVLSEIKKRCNDTLQVSYCPKTRRVHFEKATRDTDFLLDEYID